MNTHVIQLIKITGYSQSWNTNMKLFLLTTRYEQTFLIWVDTHVIQILKYLVIRSRETQIYNYSYSQHDISKHFLNDYFDIGKSSHYNMQILFGLLITRSTIIESVDDYDLWSEYQLEQLHDQDNEYCNFKNYIWGCEWRPRDVY